MPSSKIAHNEENTGKISNMIFNPLPIGVRLGESTGAQFIKCDLSAGSQVIPTNKSICQSTNPWTP